MFNIGDYVVYKREVCKICDYKKKFIGDKDYYSLIPVMDKSLKIEVPVNSDFIRSIIDKNTANEIIDNIVNIDVININDKLIESEYKRLLHDGGYEGIIKIIKPTSFDEVVATISEKDDNYFNLSEKYLYSEFAIALGISYDDVKDYVIKRIEEKNK